MGGRGLRKSPGKDHCKIVQGEHPPYPFEKIACPQEGFRYFRNKWLCCSGNSQTVIETVAKSVELLSSRQKIKLPAYFSSPRKRYVSLRGLTCVPRRTSTGSFARTRPVRRDL